MAGPVGLHGLTFSAIALKFLQIEVVLRYVY